MKFFLFSTKSKKIKKFLHLIFVTIIFQNSFINSNKETDKNTGPLVHPVMTPPSITPVGVSKFQQN